MLSDYTYQTLLDEYNEYNAPHILEYQLRNTGMDHVSRRHKRIRQLQQWMRDQINIPTDPLRRLEYMYGYKIVGYETTLQHLINTGIPHSGIPYDQMYVISIPPATSRYLQLYRTLKQQHDINIDPYQTYPLVVGNSPNENFILTTVEDEDSEYTYELPSYIFPDMKVIKKHMKKFLDNKFKRMKRRHRLQRRGY